MELLFPEMRKTEEPSYEGNSDLLSLEVPLGHPSRDDK